MERVWLYLRERFLSLRLFHTTEAIIDACCDAWNRLVAGARSSQVPCAYPWIEKITSSDSPV